MLSTAKTNSQCLFEIFSSKSNTTDVTQDLRLAAMSELDAVNLYEQLAAKTDNKLVHDVLLDIAKEEKEHYGELNKLLEILDKEGVEGMKDGAKEVEEFMRKDEYKLR